MNPALIKVMLVDDHPMVQDGLSACLSFYDDIAIVGNCGDGSAVLETAKQCQPDVILMDISMHESAEFVTNAVQAGASGYILKDTNSEEVYQAIKSIAQGKSYFSSSIAKMLIDNPPAQANARLTAREQMILSYIAKGQSSKDIAQTLTISVRTVEAHRRNIKSKLNLDSLAELVRYAVNQGLIDS